MHYPSGKTELVRSMMALFVDKGSYSSTEIDQRIRTATPQWAHDNPALAPDHIRIAMVELGLLIRSDDGETYRLDESVIMVPENMAAVLGKDYSISRIRDSDHMKKKMKSLCRRLLREQEG